MIRIFGYSRVLASGAPAPAATIDVYNPGTLVHATIYADNLGTPKTNPFVTDQNGFYFAYIPTGPVDVRVTPVGGVGVYTQGDVGGLPQIPLFTFATLPTEGALFAGNAAVVTDQGNVLYIDNGTAWVPVSSLVQSYAKASLPVAGTLGRLARVTDNERGLWMDYGTQWAAVSEQIVNVRAFGALGDGVTNDTTALQNAINIGGRIYFPPGTYLHNGLVINQPNTLLIGAGQNTILKRSTTGATPNLQINALANYCSVEDLLLNGPSTSTHGIAVIDALWCRFRNISIKGWGLNSAGLLLNTLNNPGGNGTYFNELLSVNIDGTAYDLAAGGIGGNITGSIGLWVTGTAAGANSNRMYGGSIRNCVTGMQAGFGNGFVAIGMYMSANTLGCLYNGNATNHLWLRCGWESNTQHLNVQSGGGLVADNTWLFPTFSTPLQFGVDAAIRTSIIGTDGGFDSLGQKNIIGFSQVRTSDAFMLHSYNRLGGFNSNVGIQTATLTNAPVAGNPTKWIQIDDGGVTRNLPVW